jgi:hypothetical protein
MITILLLRRKITPTSSGLKTEAAPNVLDRIKQVLPEETRTPEDVNFGNGQEGRDEYL